MSTKRYVYTYDGVNLTNEQRDFYEENGYIIIHNLVDHGLLDQLRDRFVDICDGRVDKGMMTVMKDISLRNKNVKGEFLINKIQDFQYDDVLSKYVAYPQLVDVVESIIGPNITSFNSMLINKPPDADPDASKHPLHQDLHYFPFRPDYSIVTSWTAMERVDERNGCLFVIPGTHKGTLHKHDYPPISQNVKNKAFYGVFGFEDSPKVNLVMEKGDTVFFHPLLVHGSGPNLTKGFRKAICSQYADSNCHFIDVRGTSQDNIRKEIEEIAVIRGFPVIKFNNVLKLKSRLVRGVPGNFQRFDSQL